MWHHHFDSDPKLGEGRKVAMEQICISQQKTSTLNKVLWGKEISFSNQTSKTTSSSLHLYLLIQRSAGFCFWVFIQLSSQELDQSIFNLFATKVFSWFLSWRRQDRFCKLKVRHLYMKKPSALCWLYTQCMWLSRCRRLLSCLFSVSAGRTCTACNLPQFKQAQHKNLKCANYRLKSSCWTSRHSKDHLLAT